MDDCCQVSEQKNDQAVCPRCQQRGKSVPIITLKSLLVPAALQTLNPTNSYSFCPNPECEVIYFAGERVFQKDAVKVPVFQKDDGSEVPVCYCFGWTRQRLVQAIRHEEKPVQRIREQVKENRCGCEVNNPQGSCCLRNVTAFVHGLNQSQE